MIGAYTYYYYYLKMNIFLNLSEDTNNFEDVFFYTFFSS